MIMPCYHLRQKIECAGSEPKLLCVSSCQSRISHCFKSGHISSSLAEENKAIVFLGRRIKPPREGMESRNIDENNGEGSEWEQNITARVYENIAMKQITL